MIYKLDMCIHCACARARNIRKCSQTTTGFRKGEEKKSALNNFRLTYETTGDFDYNNNIVLYT